MSEEIKIRLIELDRDNAIKAFDMANETIRLLNFNKQTYKEALEDIVRTAKSHQHTLPFYRIAREALKE